MSDFTPGVSSMKAAGIKVERAPYPVGPDGARLSLETIAQRIREGSNDSDVKRVAFNVLQQAGFHGRGASAGSTRDRVGALLNFVREWMLYSGDQPGAENIPSAAAMLCLRDNLCVRIDDCDGNLVLLGSLVSGIGILVRVVKQHFGATVQEHVLLEAQDESGAWFYADPSTNQPLGVAGRALSEVRVDPLDQSVGNVGTGAELITMGKPKACCGSCEVGGECTGVGAGAHGGGHAGGFHGGGGGRGIHHRFHGGRWWAWWPDQGGWLVVDGESCASWGAPISNPPGDVYAEASRQLQASNGAPVSEHFGGALYLFTLENGAVVIRSCASVETGYGQTLTERHPGVSGVGVGFCDFDLIKSVRARLVAPWYALNGDVDACTAFPVAQRYAFKGDFDSFVNWYSGALPNDIFCKSAEQDEIEQGRDFESRLNNWRKILSSTNCQLSAPDLPPLTQDDPRSRDYKPPEGSDIAGSIKSVLVTTAVVGAVGVGVYVTMPLLRAAVESLTQKTKAATRKRLAAR